MSLLFKWYYFYERGPYVSFISFILSWCVVMTQVLFSGMHINSLGDHSTKCRKRALGRHIVRELRLVVLVSLGWVPSWLSHLVYFIECKCKALIQVLSLTDKHAWILMCDCPPLRSSLENISIFSYIHQSIIVRLSHSCIFRVVPICGQSFHYCLCY